MSRGLEQTRIGSCSCLLYATPSPECILVQPTARHEAKNLHEEVENIVRSSGKGFVFMAFDVEKWAAALMPWHDDAVSKDESVGRNAEATLGFMPHRQVRGSGGSVAVAVDKRMGRLCTGTSREGTEGVPESGRHRRTLQERAHGTHRRLSPRASPAAFATDGQRKRDP